MKRGILLYLTACVGLGLVLVGKCWALQYEIADLGIIGNGSYAYAINNNGQVTGFWHDTYWDCHGALWQQGTVTDLGALPGYPYSGGNAINNLGHVVGCAENDFGTRHAFLWEDGAMTDLGTLVVRS